MLPDTPTMDELGMKGFSSASWMGIFVPSATPDAIVARFHDDLKAVLGDPWVRERMASMGVELNVGSSADLGAFVKCRDGALGRRGEALQHQGGVEAMKLVTFVKSGEERLGLLAGDIGGRSAAGVGRHGDVRKRA